MTTIHTRQLTTLQTRHLKIQHVQRVNNTKVRKYCIQFPVFFPTHIVLRLSPQPFTSHQFTNHINFFHKVSFLPPSLRCTSLHFTSFHFTILSDDFLDVYGNTESVAGKWYSHDRHVAIINRKNLKIWECWVAFSQWLDDHTKFHKNTSSLS